VWCGEGLEGRGGERWGCRELRWGARALSIVSFRLEGGVERGWWFWRLWGGEIGGTEMFDSCL
jgi:hypothetical protein